MENITSMVEKLAKLSRLDLGEEEKEHLGTQLRDILEAARQVQNLDTTGVEPAAHLVSSLENLREDRVVNSLSGEEILGNAPLRRESFFQVPGLFPKNAEDE